MVRPSLSCPHNFNTNKTVSLCIVIIHRMPILEVVVHHFRIVKRFRPSHAIVLPFMSHFVVAIPHICPVGGYQQHHIIRFLHGEDMKRNILQLATPGVGISNFFVIEVFLDLVTMNILWPVPPLLDEGTGENTFLAQLNNSF